MCADIETETGKHNPLMEHLWKSTQRLTCINSPGFNFQCIHKSKHRSVLFLMLYSAKKTRSVWGGKVLGQNNLLMSDNNSVQIQLSYKSQTSLAVISVEYISSQTL